MAAAIRELASGIVGCAPGDPTCQKAAYNLVASALASLRLNEFGRYDAARVGATLRALGQDRLLFVDRVISGASGGRGRSPLAAAMGGYTPTKLLADIAAGRFNGRPDPAQNMMRVRYMRTGAAAARLRANTTKERADALQTKAEADAAAATAAKEAAQKVESEAAKAQAEAAAAAQKAQADAAAKQAADAQKVALQAEDEAKLAENRAAAAEADVQSQCPTQGARRPPEPGEVWVPTPGDPCGGGQYVLATTDGGPPPIVSPPLIVEPPKVPGFLGISWTTWGIGAAVVVGGYLAFGQKSVNANRRVRRNRRRR
jgi:hypothetical protein